MSNAYIIDRNRILFETLMKPTFHKDKKNFILKEDFPDAMMDAALYQGAKEAGISDEQFMKQYYEINATFGHGVLDFLGLFDPTPASDGLNMLWYLAEGDRVNAFFSAIGAAIPYIFDTIKLTFRASYNALRGIRTGQKASSAIKGTLDAFFSVFGDLTQFISRHAQTISSFFRRILSEASPALKNFIIWCSEKINTFSDFSRKITGYKQYPLEKQAAGIESAFYDFFHDTLKNTRDAFTPDMAKRVQNIIKQPVEHPKTAAAQAAIWAAMKTPKPNFETDKNKKYQIPDFALDIPPGKKER